MRRLRTLAGRHPSLAATVGVLAVWSGVSAWLALDFTSRVRDWALMNDELFYEKLATSIATTHSPLPEIHGAVVGILNQLYPLLLAPFIGAFDMPTAFHAAHVFNAPLMASAAIPAYLLARQLVPRSWSLAVALLSVVVPWMVMTGALLTESAAYPAFIWAMLGLHLAIAAPSRRRDVLAVGALALAVLARTQFVFLVAVLPLAILLNEIAWSRERGRARLLDAGRTSVRRHPLLAGLYGAGCVLAVVLAAFGLFDNLLGRYSVTAHGSPLPSGVWRAIAMNLDRVALGCGLVPLILGGGWMLSTVARPTERKTHALATLCLLATAALTVETASFDVRFPGEGGVRDRYLFYLVPLLFVGAAAALAEGRRRATALGAAVCTVLFAATAPLLPFSTPPGYLVDAPAAIVNHTLVTESSALGTGTFVALAALLLGIAVSAGLLVLPRRAFALAVLAFLLPFCILATHAGIDRALASSGPSKRPFAGPPGMTLDWVDTTLPAGTTAAMIPFPISGDFGLTAVLWWDVEFWNKSIVRTFVDPTDHFSYAPFPNRVLAPDWSTGRIPGTSDAPPFVVVFPGDSRFRLAGPRHAANLGLEVLLADRPYQAVWASRGLDIDGWMLARHPATIRVYAPAGDQARLAIVQITLTAPPAPATYSVGGRTVQLNALELRSEQVEVCVPAAGSADIALSSRSSAEIPAAPTAFAVTGTRRVGVHVGPVQVEATGKPC